MKSLFVLLFLALSVLAYPIGEAAEKLTPWELGVNTEVNENRFVQVGDFLEGDSLNLKNFSWSTHSISFLNLGSPTMGKTLVKWIYLEVENLSSDSIMGIFFEKGNLLNVEMWYGDSFQNYSSFGNEVPRAQSWLGSFPPHEKLKLGQGAITPVLIRVENEMATIATFEILHPLEYKANYYFKKMGELPFYGCIIFLILFNSILAVRNPKMGYGVYAFYHLFHLVYLGCQYGFIEEFMFPNMGYSTKLILITFSLTAIFSFPAFFIATWFKLKSRSIKVLTKITVAACLFFLVGNSINSLWFGAVGATFLILLLAVFSLNLIRIGIFDKDRVLFLFGLSWGMHVSFVMLFMTYLFGMGEEYPWLYHSYLIGVVAEAVLFAFALSENQKRIQNEKDSLTIEKTFLLEKHYKELEEETAIRRGLVRGMSHELRTPVNQLNQVLDEKDFNSEQLRTQAKRLLNQSHKIIDLSSLMENELEVNLRPFPVLDWLEGLEADPISQKVQFTHTKLPYGLEGDSDRIRDIVIQLLENCHKHAQSHGVVVSLGYSNETFKIEVSDRGPGCDERQLLGRWEQLKERNFLDTGKGLGMGMILVHGLCDSLNAKLSFETSDLGLSVLVEVPAKSWEEPQRLSKKVLAVDDQALNLKLLEKVLKKDGHDLYSANNGQEAIEIIKNNPDIELVFMDVQMPIMDGIEATQKIRIELNSDVKIIALTANAERSICIEAGMNGYLPKPLKKSEVLAMVHTI